MRPDIAKVAYYHIDHAREDGTLTHGSEDKHFVEKRSTYPPQMSIELEKSIKVHLN